MAHWSLLAAWLVVPWSLCLAGEPLVLLVPQDFPTIQAAADAAADGDTIEIRAGTYAESVTLTGASGVTIRAKGKVVLAPPAGSGLLLDACIGVSVEKLRVRGGTLHGIHLLDSTDCTLLRCKVETAALDGIRTDGGSGHLVERCSVKESGRDAVALAVGGPSRTNGSIVRNCKLTRPGDDGVDVNGNDNLVERCTTIQPLEDGYEVDDTTLGSDNEFRDCKAIAPAFSGFYVSGSANTIRRGKVVRSGDDGISLPSGSQHLVEDCKLVKPGFDGVFVGTPVTAVTITGTRVSKCADDAFDVQGDGAALSHNKAARAGDNGYEIEGLGGLYDGNQAKGSQQNGFELAADAAGNTLVNNKARGSQGFDLFDGSGGANTVDATNDFKTVGP